MRVLAVRQPYAERIANGDKTIEIRSRITNIKERVAIYATRTRIHTADAGWMRHMGYKTDESMCGHIIGTVEMCGVEPTYNQEMFNSNMNKHLCPPHFYKEGLWNWYLCNPVKINEVPFKMPRGAVVWSFVNDELIDEASSK